MKRRKGFYSISVVAKMFSVHQQTIRMYEKEGLISPKRSEGNTRLFSEEDVDRLEEVIYLTHKLGVNLAGVEMILKLQKKIRRMQEEMNKMFKAAEGEFELETQQMKESMRRQGERLIELRKENSVKKHEHLIEISTPDVEDDEKTMTKKRSKPSVNAKQGAKGQQHVVLSKPKAFELEDDDTVEDIEIEYDK